MKDKYADFPIFYDQGQKDKDKPSNAGTIYFKVYQETLRKITQSLSPLTKLESGSSF